MFPIGNVAAFAAAVRRLIEQPALRHDLQIRAYQRVEQRVQHARERAPAGRVPARDRRPQTGALGRAGAARAGARRGRPGERPGAHPPVVDADAARGRRTIMKMVTFWQVLPALVVFLYFVVGLVAFSARTVAARHAARPRDRGARPVDLHQLLLSQLLRLDREPAVARAAGQRRARQHRDRHRRRAWARRRASRSRAGASRSAAGSFSSRGSSTRSTGGSRARTARRRPAARSSTRCSIATPTR